jgi:hypothetical protein
MKLQNALIALLLVVVGWLAYLQFRDRIGIVNPQPVIIYVQSTTAVEPMFFPTAVIPVVPTWTYPPPVNDGATLAAMVPTPAPVEFQRDGLSGQPVATGVVGEHDPGDGHRRSTAGP